MTTRTIGGGFAYRDCDCEDYPCCGHNDYDPDWEPDPYDDDDRWQYYERDDFGPEDEDDDEDEDEDEALVMQPAWRPDPARPGATCEWCGARTVLNAEGVCHDCWEPF